MTDGNSSARFADARPQGGSRADAAAYSPEPAAILGPLCALLYYLAASLELALRAPGAPVALLAPQSAMLVALLLTIQQRNWWFVALATLPAHLMAYLGSGPWWQLAWHFGHTLLLAIGIGSTLHLLLGQRNPFESLPGFLLYIVTAAVAGPVLLSGFAPSVVLTLWAHPPGAHGLGQAVAHWREEVLSSSLAMLTWAPCIYMGLLSGWGWSWRQHRTPSNFGVGVTSAAITLVATLVAAKRASSVDLQIFLMLVAFTVLLIAIVLEERRRAARAASEGELALKQRDERLALIARAAHDLIYDWDISRGEIWSSDGDDCGNPAPGVRECRLEIWGNCIFAGDRERVVLDCRQALRGNVAKWEAEYRRSPRGSATYWVRHRAFILRDATGVATRMVGVVTDLSDRKKLEEANDSLARFARLAMLGQITASIAHEMNQPLGAIRYNAEAGLLYLERERYDQSAFREIFDDICRDNRRASELIRGMRELLQDHELRLDPLDINDVVTDVVKLVRIESRRRQIQLITQCGKLPTMLGDHGRLQQVLLNLILNGMDATAALPEWRRRIAIRTSCIGATRIQVEVVDRGSGIDPENLPKVFDSFFTSKDHGMGLGLAIARSIVEAHGGRIWARNNADGVGATLAFEVDCHLDSKPMMPVPNSATRYGARLN